MPKHLPDRMRAMQIHAGGILTRDYTGLRLDTLPVPEPGPGEVLIKVGRCGVCHTEIDEIEGRAPPASLPMTPGHQVVGQVVAEGPYCSYGLSGKQVGVAWIHSSCGQCSHCRKGLENLCADFRATGMDRPGGYAQFMCAPEAFVHELPAGISNSGAAPLLCAGAVGYRALKLCRLEDGESLGLTGFGASAHLVLQMAKALYPNSAVFVFARDKKDREFALALGAQWAGETRENAPQKMDAIIDTTPAWQPVVSALEALAPNGRLVINAIRKESADHVSLNELDYAHHLWREKSLKTVANVTRKDVRNMLSLASRLSLEPQLTLYPLEQAHQALLDIKSGALKGAAVLDIN